MSENYYLVQVTLDGGVPVAANRLRYGLQLATFTRDEVLETLKQPRFKSDGENVYYFGVTFEIWGVIEVVDKTCSDETFEALIHAVHESHCIKLD